MTPLRGKRKGITVYPKFRKGQTAFSKFNVLPVQIVSVDIALPGYTDKNGRFWSEDELRTTKRAARQALKDLRRKHGR